mgnify:CR=1 FL=1
MIVPFERNEARARNACSEPSPLLERLRPRLVVWASGRMSALLRSVGLGPDEIEVGMQFEGVPGDGDAEDDFAGIDAAAADDDHDDHDDHDADADEGGHIYTVTDVADDTVVLDGNHPFAGMALKFVCTVRGVRPATPAELERGSAEDPTGGVLRVLH